jgi:hypothetical protein
MPAPTPLPEPAGLRDHLLELLLEDRAPAAEVAAVAGYAISAAWRDELRARAVDLGVLRAAVRGYVRELRLWAMGERRWQPTAEALLERAVRRSPALAGAARHPSPRPPAAPAPAAKAPAQVRGARRPAA